MDQSRTIRQRVHPEWREWWDERVAIMVVDGQLARDDAQRAATDCLILWAQDHAPVDYSREGKVYILHAEGTTSYKIGRSQNPIARIEQLQIGTPTRLHLLREIYQRDAMTLEGILHKRYADYCTHGEWFALPPHILEALLHEEFTL